MLQVQTQVKVIDNSGVKKGQTIKIYQGKQGSVGDIIQISVKQLQPRTKLKLTKGDVLKALIVRTTYRAKNALNHYIAFDENSVILLNAQHVPLASRILGPIPLQLRQKKQVKILSLASTLI